MEFDIIFFDLDSTLYPDSNGLWQAIKERIDLYLSERMGWSPDEIPEIRHKLFMDHGTTLKGLQINYDVNPNEYLEFVHNIPLNDYLAPDPMLREILLNIPTRRWVFTNADKAHADRVLNILGIQECFEGLIDVWVMSPFVKPMKESYEFAMSLTGVENPRKCVLIDDSPRNTISAKELGMFTVLIGDDGTQISSDRFLNTINDLPNLLLEISTS